jgi:hypothetical protein
MLLLAANASAQQPPNPPKEQRGPMPEAFDACKGKKDGDAAQMKTPRGEVIAGTCRMVLVPQRGPDDRNPPRERPPAK